MEVDRNNIEKLGRIHHQFCQSIVESNITEIEWRHFFSRIRDVYQSLGLDYKSLVIEPRGSRWRTPTETIDQERETNLFISETRDELYNHIEQWLDKYGKWEWDSYLEFLYQCKNIMISGIQDYYDFNRVRFDPDETDEEMMDRYMGDDESSEILLDPDEFDDPETRELVRKVNQEFNQEVDDLRDGELS